MTFPLTLLPHKMAHSHFWPRASLMKSGRRVLAQTNIVVGHDRFNVQVRDPRSLRSRARSGAAEQGVKKVTAPMPGKVVRLLVEVGARVEANQSVIVIEAMKMQNE